MTLIQYPKTRLGELFSGNYKSQLSNKNELFIDRNGHAFRYVLEYHRTGRILWTPSNELESCNGVGRKEMILEFEYFGIPNDLKQQQELDDKEYNLNEIRDLFKELSVTTFPSANSSTNHTIPSPINTTQTYVPNHHGNNEVIRLRRWTSNEEHGQIVDSFIIALKDVIYELYRNFRRNINLIFH